MKQRHPPDRFRLDASQTEALGLHGLLQRTAEVRRHPSHKRDGEVGPSVGRHIADQKATELTDEQLTNRCILNMF